MSTSGDNNAPADGNKGGHYPWWQAIAVLAFALAWPVVAKIADINADITAYVLISVLGAFGIAQVPRRR